MGSKLLKDPWRLLPVRAAACVFDSRQDRMGNEAASVAILRHGETPIKADYDVDKVTQQIALIYTRQETSVFPPVFFF